MRTLKKVLALSLVFAMAFTMMAGAAFKDQDKIDSALNSDIQLLTALGVFKGDENGNFNPTANVKRSEAAKMIYVLKNNGVDDGAVAFQGVSKYADVPVGHWAEGYINYCTNLGYMGGWKEGNVQKFDPDGNVTGVELTKMLLCMIGYKADVQSYTGNGWQTNVLQDAATSGLSVEYVPSFYAAAPRQWTARLMTNAIDANYVVYSKGELTFKDETYGEFALKLHTAEGVLVNAGKVALNNDSAPTTVALNENGDQIVLAGTITPSAAPTTFKTTVDASLLGQYVKVYYRAGTTADTHKVYAVLATGKSKVYETTLGDVTVGTYAGGETIKFEGYNGGSAKKYANSATIAVVENLNTVNTVTANGTTATFGAIAGNSSNPVRFVDQTGDGTIDLAFVTTTTYAKVDAYNTDKNVLKFVDADNTAVTVSNVSAITSAIDSAEEMKYVKVEGTIAKDDVVAINIDTTSGKQMVVVSKVEPKTSSVTAYTLGKVTDWKASNPATDPKVEGYATVTIDGTAAKFSKFAMNKYDLSTANGTVLNDKTFYTDGKYIVYSTGGTTAASVENLAYITDVDTTTAWGDNTYKVKALLTDGTVGEYVVDSVYDELGVKVAVKASVDEIATADEAGYTNVYTGTKTTTSINGAALASSNNGAQRYDAASKVKTAMETLFKTGAAKEKVFSYSLSGDKITLRALKSDNTTTFAFGTQQYANDTKKVTVSTSEYKLADNAYFFVKNDKDANNVKYSVVKASELAKKQDSTDGSVYAYKTVGGIPTFLFGVLNLKTSVNVTEAKYAFVKSVANYAVVDGKYLAQMTVVLPDGSDKIVSKKFSDSASANQEVAAWNKLRGNVVTYTMEGDYIDSAVAQVTATGTNDTFDVDEWNKLEILGWSNTLANVKINSGTTEKLVAVASNVKIHYVDCTTNKYAVIDSASKVEKTAVAGKQSGYAYVQKINNVDTITDIFVEVDGADATPLWTPAP